MREEYEGESLDEATAGDDPVALFERWYDDAVAAELPQPDAMVLSTVGEDGRPSSRAVLFKGLNEKGFAFFTNYESRKGQELRTRPEAALCFVWLTLHRQVRIEGEVSLMEPEESDAYFATRPRGAQIAASISPQSTVVPSRRFLEEAFERLEEDVGSGPITRPAHWGGFRLSASSIEFWQGRRNRLHDRLRYIRHDGAWSKERLAP